MQYACPVLSVACPALQYFSTLSDMKHDFVRKKLIENKIGFDFLYNFA
jgi:hypothetical protein